MNAITNTLHSRPSGDIVLKKTAPESEFSHQFLQAMIDRMGVSFHKYGPVADAYPDNVDAIKSLILRLAKYIGTTRISQSIAEIIEEKGELRGDGNTEWLADAGNFSMIEFMCPSHPRAHFTATHSHQSPGRAWKPDGFDGSTEISSRANDLGPQ